MSVPLTPQMLAALEGGAQSCAIFVQFEYATVTSRWWTGFGLKKWRGAYWSGAGQLGGISTLRSDSDGRAIGVTYTLSGIPLMWNGVNMAEYIDRHTRLGGQVDSWWALFDATGAIIPDPMPIHGGDIDAPVITVGRDSLSVAQACETGQARAQARSGYRYDDETQRTFFPDCRGMEYMADLQDAKVT
jgi:hypothetical protein